MKDFATLRQEAAVAVFESGTVRIDLKKGFKIKVHDKYPKAPQSPFYASLRPNGVKDGKLLPGDFLKMGRALAAKARQSNLIRKRAVVGIPAAGEPLASAFISCLNTSEAGQLSRKRLIKITHSDGTREISGFQGDVQAEEINDMLVIDDLMTQAETKLETNTQIRNAGGTMTDLLLFMSRSQNGAAELAKIGITTHVVWEFEELMEFWLGKAYITRHEYDVIMDYPNVLQSYIASQI